MLTAAVQTVRAVGTASATGVLEAKAARTEKGTISSPLLFGF
jgi:hypothetical protein